MFKDAFHNISRKSSGQSEAGSTPSDNDDEDDDDAEKPLSYTQRIVVKPVQYVFKSPSIPWEQSREYTSKMKRLFPKMKRVTKTLSEPETKQEMSKRQLMQRNASKKEVHNTISKGEQPSDLTRNESFVLLGVVLVLTIAVSHMEKAEISVPISVTALWLTIAFLLGYIVSEKRQTTRKEHHEKAELARQKAVLLAGAKESVKDDSVPSDFSSVLMNYEEPEQIEACDLLKERTLKYTSTDGSTLNQLIRLIGSEMFLSDRPEEELWKDKLLLSCGLRDRPTFLVNALFPWGSYLVYFELPPWVKKFENISEEEGDHVDIKAFKRFLKGDADYRNERLYVMPVVTDAKMAVRMVVPNKNEFRSNAGMAPVSWSQDDEHIDNTTGETRHAVLELAVDCMSDKTIRTFVSFMRRYLVTMTLEASVMIDKPHNSTENEPGAFLSFFKWDKVDLAKCTVLPPKSEQENMLGGKVYIPKK
eukprot:scaffold167959_cov59-Attheya_sp.AAC.1